MTFISGLRTFSLNYFSIKETFKSYTHRKRGYIIQSPLKPIRVDSSKSKSGNR